MKKRSGEAVAAQHRKAGPMHHRLRPRGGAKDDQSELLDGTESDVIEPFVVCRQPLGGFDEPNEDSIPFTEAFDCANQAIGNFGYGYDADTLFAFLSVLADYWVPPGDYARSADFLELARRAVAEALNRPSC